MSFEMIPVLFRSIVVFYLIKELVVVVMITCMAATTEQYTIRFTCVSSIPNRFQVMNLQSFQLVVFSTFVAGLIVFVKCLFKSFTSRSQVLALAHFLHLLFRLYSHSPFVKFYNHFSFQNVRYLLSFYDDFCNSFRRSVPCIDTYHVNTSYLINSSK